MYLSPESKVCCQVASKERIILTIVCLLYLAPSFGLINRHAWITAAQIVNGYHILFPMTGFK